MAILKYAVYTGETRLSLCITTGSLSLNVQLRTSTQWVTSVVESCRKQSYGKGYEYAAIASNFHGYHHSYVRTLATQKTWGNHRNPKSASNSVATTNHDDSTLHMPSIWMIALGLSFFPRCIGWLVVDSVQSDWFVLRVYILDRGTLKCRILPPRELYIQNSSSRENYPGSHCYHSVQSQLLLLYSK